MKQDSPAQWLLVTHVEASDADLDKVKEVLRRPRELDRKYPRALFQQMDSPTLVELVAMESPADLDSVLEDAELEAAVDELEPVLPRDWRREIVRQKEIVIRKDAILPASKNLQLRHIEVPPTLLPEYHEWRERTIFAHVRRRKDIDSFVAYHSSVSSTPGVLFVVGFSGTVEDLAAGFNTPEYQDIVRQANRYIVGGSANLYTRAYERVELGQPAVVAGGAAGRGGGA